MKQKALIIAVFILGHSLISMAADRGLQRDYLQQRAPIAESVRASTNHLDEIVYFEDWEDGTLAGWVPKDLTAVTATWHLDSYQAFGGSGTSWWVGDPDVGTSGGYWVDWYMTLNSPAIELGAAPMLLFWHRYSCEDPLGENPPYNGFDGMNLRISTDGGNTWEIVTTVTPTYNVTSSYAFGYWHDEGPNIPQWSGTTGGTSWQQVTADLSAWANQTAIIRWAFASDQAYSTPENLSMFGWMVDNIRVYSGQDTILTHDAEAVEGFTTESMALAGGNLWRVGMDDTPENGTHIVVCNNEETNLYNPDMSTVLESPMFNVSGLPAGYLLADVRIHGAVSCETGEFPDCDYWGVEVSVDEGNTWCAISNPSCDPTGMNFVYTDCPSTWAQFNYSYSHTMDLSEFLLPPDPPENIMLRFTLETNSDANLEVGPKFDNFSLEYQGGFPNDIQCYTLQVKYPTVINRPISVRAYFENSGTQSQFQVPAWYRITGNTQQRFLPNLLLSPGGRDTRDAVLTIENAGDYEIMAWSGLATDQDQSNDSCAAPPPPTAYGHVFGITVQDSDEEIELGYDNRHILYRYSYSTGVGPLVRFTPADDGIEGDYDLNGVQASFYGYQSGTHPIRLHVFAGGSSVPGTEIYNEEFPVSQNETGDSEWKEFDVSGSEETREMTGDFWVWLETVTSGEDRYPQILGNSEEDWDDEHFYVWDGSSTPNPSTVFFMIHASIAALCEDDQGAATVEVAAGGPPTWNYRAVWESGCIDEIRFTNFCDGTSASVTGQAELAGWYVAEESETEIVFRGGVPIQPGNTTIEGLILEHPFCTDHIGWEAGTNSGSVEGPLPVELLDFAAVAGNRSVILSWSTASETDNDRFRIYRDSEFVGQVSATNLSSGDNYQWTDQNLVNGREYLYELHSVDFSGTEELIGSASATPLLSSTIVTEYALHQNFPNPFNPETRIIFDMVESGNATIAVFNSLGQTVATLVKGSIPEGRHSVSFDAAGLPSGLYFYQMKAGDFTAIRKMVLMK